MSETIEALRAELVKARNELDEARVDLAQARKEYDEEERLHGNTIDARDRAQDAADRLANAVAEYFGAEIGEHSSLNDPWENAADVLAGAQYAREMAKAEATP